MPAKAKARAKSKGAPRRSVKSASASASSPKRRAARPDSEVLEAVETSAAAEAEVSEALPLGQTAEVSLCSPSEVQALPHEPSEQQAEVEAAAATPESTDAEAAADFTSRGELLLEVPDPWPEVSHDDAMLRIQEETWCVLELQCITGLDSRAAFAELVEDEAGIGAAHIDGKGAEMDGFPTCSHVAQAAVSLDFSGNLLENLESLPAMWLRSLSLANNPLTSLDGLALLFPKLLSIDISFVDLPSVEGAWKSLAACPHLRSIDAEGCGIDCLEEMEAMPSLRAFNLVDNALEDLESLALLGSCCQLLRCLDLRENPVSLEVGYRKAVSRHLPNLMEHDNQSKKTYVPKPRDHHCGFSASGPKEVHAVDGLFRYEHCSCLEGNPCLDPATCMDWPNREKVASSVRESFHLPQGQWSKAFSFRGSI